MVSDTKSFSLRKKLLGIVILCFAVCFFFVLPDTLFNKPTSFVIDDENGNLLSATIAADGQWRFPGLDSLPLKFIQCIKTFEDKRFFYHPGVDPIALSRAIYKNMKAGHVISGGSTLTMQVIRLSRGEKRNLWQKVIESILAIRLECTYSKHSILKMYAANAPFGSNVVGLEAASWRYYARSAEKLSWGEMAALCVLPNAPSLIHPGKNRQLLLEKRNKLIDKLIKENIISETEGALAKNEPLPGKPQPLPQWAPHLLERFKKEYEELHHQNSTINTRITSTIQQNLQQNVTYLINRYQNSYKGNGINNAAAMVLQVETGNVIAYVGNVNNYSDSFIQSHVDVLNAPRSPGSVLKPLLYAAMQSDGLILPQQLIPDIPTQIGGYTPQNFDLSYDGAVPANKALSRSLNVPAVKLLQQYKYQRFYDVLKNCGFSTLSKPADHYGLSIILGGCEITPWELGGVYSSLAREYLNQKKNAGKFSEQDWHMPRYIKSSKSQTLSSSVQKNAIKLPISYTAIWHTFNAMQEVMRPGEEGLWNLFNSAQRIAWKTGTSFGFRDGWAIGITPKYCVVVWVGNTNGEGRSELTGINTAAPIMFDIFRLLPPGSWFQPPTFDYAYVPVCHQSGYRASMQCSMVDTLLVCSKGSSASLCPYHFTIHLDVSLRYRVNSSCVQPINMKPVSWFILPPAIEFYYKQQHSDYDLLPPVMKGCNEDRESQLEIIYPEPNAKIFVPKEVTGFKGKTIFTAAHSNPQATLYWHLDDQFLGSTFSFHQIELNPAKGMHQLTVVDNFGSKKILNIQILEKE